MTRKDEPLYLPEEWQHDIDDMIAEFEAAAMAAGAEETMTDQSPARRYILEQSWWIASELCRRHPEFEIHEVDPTGIYDELVVGPSADELVHLNRSGRIHIVGTPDADAVTWADVLAAATPHDIVKLIETRRGWRSPSPAPTSTPRTLAYRLLSRILTVTLNDRASWDVRSEYGSGPQSGGGRGFLAQFPTARNAVDASRGGEEWEVLSKYWAVTRDDEPVILVDIDGTVHLRDGTSWGLMEYYEIERNLGRVIAEMLSHLLP